MSESRRRIGVSFWVGAVVFVIFLLSLGWSFLAPGFVANVFSLISQVALVSIVIWQACDPFADAAQWIGIKFRIPGSVRGATLDAVASSLPELFSGVFFVLVALSAGQQMEIQEKSGAGFGATIATVAGSAVYNMMLIPAACAILISYVRPSRPTIDIENRVITRDGMWFLVCEIVLLVFLFQAGLHWWMALILIGMYLAYVAVLYFDARKFQHQFDRIQEKVSDGVPVADAIAAIQSAGEHVSQDMINRFARPEKEASRDDQHIQETTAGVFFGLFQPRLNQISVWVVLLISTTVTIAACYWLVDITFELAGAFEIPVFFVAVIVAAAASSVPDTFLSIASARRGDDDGAVSNAFGSNIFDITVCLAIPLLVATYVSGWSPVSLTFDGQPMTGLVGLRILLLVFSIATLGIMWHKRQLTRRKAWLLIGMYGLFVLYAVFGSLENHAS